MSAFSTLVNIFAFIGFIVIVIYLIYYLWNYLQKLNAAKIDSNTNPPSEYMQQTGIKCPDYWVNVGVDSNGNYICRNSYNINVNNSNTSGNCSNVQCYADPDKKEVNFSPITSGYTWMPNNPDGLTSYTETDKQNFVKDPGSANTSRCDWLKCCGPKISESNNYDAVWLGVNDYCNASSNSM
jgi:hypothetical protein